MAKLLEFKGKPERNLYLVDSKHITLALSSDEALKFVQYNQDTDREMDVQLMDDQKEYHVIKVGKTIEIVLWDREPKPLERVSRMLKVRDFIDRDLKGQNTPSGIDIIDENAIIPKR